MKNFSALFRKFSAGFIAAVLSIAVLSGSLSIAADTQDSSQYGTAEEGIYTSGANTSVFSLDPVDFLKNGDFSEGLKYWAPSYTVEKQNTAYYASVENGALKLSPNGTSGNKVVTSAAITVPESLKGKSMTVLMWYKSDAAGRFQFGVYTNNYTNIFNNGYGNIYDFSKSDELKFAAFNFTAPESGAISLYLKAEGSMTFNMYIDRFALATKNADGTYNMFTTSFDAETEVLTKSGEPCYGTESDGIYTVNYATSVFGRPAVNFLKNGDFSEGLKYWAPSYTVENQNTAYYASVENGALKLSPNGTSGNKVVTSAAITVPESLKGKSMTVLMWYKSDAAGRFQFGVYTNNYTNIFNNGYGNIYDFSKSDELKFAAFNFTAPESGAISLYLKAEGSMTFNMYIDRFALATKNADGTYNMFCGSFDSETELLNAAGYPCYGEEDKGMYVKDASTKATAAPAADVFNGNFEQGLKYWALANGTGYASDIGSIDAETGLFKTVGSKGTYNGLTSVYYNLPETAYGKKIVVKYDSKSTAGIGVTLTASNSTDTVSVSSDNFAKSKNVVSSLTKELTLAEGYTKLSVSFKQYGAADGDTTYIGNFRIYILDEGGLGLLADLDLSPVGYDYGDTNADGSVDIRDIVRLKSYLADSDDTKIYIAAANLAGETNMSLSASDVTLLSEKIILK